MLTDEAKEAEKETGSSCGVHELMTFAFHCCEAGIDIKIIGCLAVRSAPKQPAYSKGIVQIENKVFPVFDLQALAGLKPKTVTSDSCVVLLDPNETFTDFSRAIIVDDVAEMLRIAEGNISGLPIENFLDSRCFTHLKKTSEEFSETKESYRNGQDKRQAVLSSRKKVSGGYKY